MSFRRMLSLVGNLGLSWKFTHQQKISTGQATINLPKLSPNVRIPMAIEATNKNGDFVGLIHLELQHQPDVASVLQKSDGLSLSKVNFFLDFSGINLSLT
eukprot:TRINITY_DN641_c0_g1_i1.p1 TRINITY_DN641_c0_g1~~TRINITY_DN641_c0_g1_i1.p1  ORF type:complete len:100 (-),score=15.35 TRINITY_DN641_c0_g1_i1:825-1124(-)